MRRGVYALLVLLVLAQGCVSLPWGAWSATEPTFKLKKDIHQNIPPWEAKLFDSEPAKGAPGLTTSELQKKQKNVVLMAKISKYTSPALYVLLKQVDEKNVMLATDQEEENILKGAPGLHQQRQMNSNFAAENEKPLPTSLASQPLIRAYVRSLAAAFHNSNIKRGAAAKNIVPPKGYPLEDEEFTVLHFRQLGEAFLNANLAMVQINDLVNSESATHFNRIARMNTSDSTGFNAETQSLGITWSGVAFEYFTAYYKGNFVDRAGGKLSKPDIGQKISNETITGAVTVGLESIFDWLVLSHSKGTEGGVFKAPVVFKNPENPVFQTAGNQKPTLVVLTQKLLKKDRDHFMSWKYVVEKQASNDEEGISAPKLKVIRYVSGIAGDGAGSLSSLIARTFGGIHLGFILFGKVSVGDNETLSKLVETSIDNVARRSSEMFASGMLYDVTFTDPKPTGQDSLAVQLVKYIAMFDGDQTE